MRNLTEINSGGLVPGISLVNNLLAGNGLGGIQFSGDPAGGPSPFGRIVNNTIFGTTQQYYTFVAPTGPQIKDGETFSITDGYGKTATFEFMINAALTVGDIGIPILGTETAQQIVTDIVNAVNAAGINVLSVVASAGGTAGTVQLVNATAVTQLTYSVPAGSPSMDGQTFTVTDNQGKSVTYEFVIKAALVPGFVQIKIAGTETPAQIATDITTAVTASGQTLDAAATLGPSSVTNPVTVEFLSATKVSTSISGFTLLANAISTGAAGNGVNVINDASPTIVNNILYGNATGIAVDASSSYNQTTGAGTVAENNLFQFNTANGDAIPNTQTGGTDIVIPVTTSSIFVNAAVGNFNLNQTLIIPPGGTGYTSAPTVAFSGGGGTGATATATVVGGIVTSITITKGGSGYTSAPTITLTGGGGTGVVSTAAVAGGAVTSISIHQGTINNPAIDAGLNSVIDRPAMVAVEQGIGLPPSPIISPAYDINDVLRVSDPLINPTGRGQSPYIDLGAIEHADFADPTAQLISPNAGGQTSVTVIGQTTTQFTIELSDGNGAGVDSDTVSVGQFTLTYNGATLQPITNYNYSYDPTSGAVTFTSATGSWANGTYVVSINNTIGGSYTSAPTVTFSGGGGTGAAATATVVNGVVTGITVTSAGSGYTSAPTVTLSGGGGAGTTATATVGGGGVKSLTIINGGSGVTDLVGNPLEPNNATTGTTSFTINLGTPVTTVPTNGWQNPGAYVGAMFDVDNDGVVTPLDALILINALTTRIIVDPVGNPTSPYEVTLPANGLLPTPAPALPLYYYDVSGDGFLTPSDALLIITYLTTNPVQVGVVAPAVTEASTTADVATATGAPTYGQTLVSPQVTAPSAGTSVNPNVVAPQVAAATDTVGTTPAVGTAPASTTAFAVTAPDVSPLGNSAAVTAAAQTSPLPSVNAGNPSARQSPQGSTVSSLTFSQQKAVGAALSDSDGWQSLDGLDGVLTDIAAAVQSSRTARKNQGSMGG